MNTDYELGMAQGRLLSSCGKEPSWIFYDRNFPIEIPPGIVIDDDRLYEFLYGVAVTIHESCPESEDPFCAHFKPTIEQIQRNKKRLIDNMAEQCCGDGIVEFDPCIWCIMTTDMMFVRMQSLSRCRQIDDVKTMTA